VPYLCIGLAANNHSLHLCLLSRSALQLTAPKNPRQPNPKPVWHSATGQTITVTITNTPMCRTCMLALQLSFYKHSTLQNLKASI
jgi:hypothetical protein